MKTVIVHLAAFICRYQHLIVSAGERKFANLNEEMKNKFNGSAHCGDSC